MENQTEYFYIVRDIETDIIEHVIALSSQEDVRSFDAVGKEMIKVSSYMEKHGNMPWNNGNPSVNPQWVREERNRLLAETDWMSSGDRVMSDAERQYREDLRNVTEQSGFPDNVVWPTKP